MLNDIKIICGPFDETKVTDLINNIESVDVIDRFAQGTQDEHFMCLIFELQIIKNNGYKIHEFTTPNENQLNGDLCIALGDNFDTNIEVKGSNFISEFSANRFDMNGYFIFNVRTGMPLVVKDQFVDIGDGVIKRRFRDLFLHNCCSYGTANEKDPKKKHMGWRVDLRLLMTTHHSRNYEMLDMDIKKFQSVRQIVNHLFKTPPKATGTLQVNR